MSSGINVLPCPWRLLRRGLAAGSAALALSLAVPAAAQQATPSPSVTAAPPEPERYSTEMWGTGIAFCAIGGAGLTASGVLGIVALTAFGPHSLEDVGSAAIATLIGGSIGLAVGIPLVVVGGKRVDAQTTTTTKKYPSPTLIVGPHRAALHVAF